MMLRGIGHRKDVDKDLNAMNDEGTIVCISLTFILYRKGSIYLELIAEMLI
jgi:hypothetical protein